MTENKSNKKALLIGINYANDRSNRLSGCINDVLHIRNFIKEEYGFEDQEIYLMTELSEDSKKIPTKKNIMEGIKWLMNDVNEHSQLFMHYSGHGSHVRDRNKEERDGKDEVICPLDFNRSGYISDDVLRKLLVDPLCKGAKLTVIADCCHSGTVCDLRVNYKVTSNPRQTRYIIDVDEHYTPSKGHVLLFSGCLDKQYSADAWEEGKAQGAMSYCFLKTFQKYKKEGKKPSYLDMIKYLTVFIKNKGYEQIPQMSSGHMLDLNSEFSIL